MRITQRKGEVATAQAIATFTARGFDVSIPLTESAAYYLIVDKGERLLRVQCKNGYVVKRVQHNAYDWLYVLAADGSEYLIPECLHGRRSVNLLSVYRLGAVAESG